MLESLIIKQTIKVVNSDYFVKPMVIKWILVLYINGI